MPLHRLAPLALLAACGNSVAPSTDSGSTASDGDSADSEVLPSIVITEFSPHGSLPYIELVNTGDEAVDLDGCTVTNAADQSFSLAQTAPIPPAAHVVLVAFAHSGEGNFDTPVALVEPWFDWPDQSFELHALTDFIALHCDEVLVDRVAYDDLDPGTPTACRSLSLDPAAVDATANDEPASWCFTPLEGDVVWWDFSCLGTPGLANPSCG